MSDSSPEQAITKPSISVTPLGQERHFSEPIKRVTAQEATRCSSEHTQQLAGIAQQVPHQDTR